MSIEDFEQRWQHTRGMTIEFLEGASDDCLDFRPGPAFSTIREQARHLICVQGMYHLGLRGMPVDFSGKESYYEGPVDAPSLIAGLRAADDELADLLAQIRRNGDEFEIDWYGNLLGIAGYGAVFVQHEALHHGQWVVHARLGGFPTPIGWLLNWGL